MEGLCSTVLLTAALWHSPCIRSLSEEFECYNTIKSLSSQAGNTALSLQLPSWLCFIILVQCCAYHKWGLCASFQEYKDKNLLTQTAAELLCHS